MEFFVFNTKNRKTIHKITLTAMMLTLVVIFQFLERFFLLGFGFLKLNFSLLFILPIFYFNGFWWGTLLFLFRMIFGLSLSGFNQISLISQAVLLIHELIAVLLMYFYSLIFRFQKNHQYKLFNIIISTLVSVILISTFLNTLLFFPLYISAINDFDFLPSISNAMLIYPKMQMLFFNIINYWWGTIAVYSVGNAIKFGLMFIMYWPLARIFRFYKKAVYY